MLIFFGVVKCGFLLGVFAKSAYLVWCFCGEVVVKCVVKLVSSRPFFGAEKQDTSFNFIFGRGLDEF